MYNTSILWSVLFSIFLNAVPVAASDDTTTTAQTPALSTFGYNSYYDPNDPADVVCCILPYLYIGAGVAINFAYTSGADESLAFGAFEVRNPKPLHQAGGTAGVQIEYRFGWREYATYSSLSSNISFTSLPMLFRKTVTTPLDFSNTASPVSEAVYTSDVSLSMVNIDVLYKYMLGRTRLGIMAGPEMGFVLSGTEHQTLALTDDASTFFVHNEAAAQRGITFSDDVRTAAYSARDISGLNKLQLALRAGLFYEILFYGPYYRYVGMPYIAFSYPLTSLREKSQGKVLKLQLGFQCQYLLY